MWSRPCGLVLVVLGPWAKILSILYYIIYKNLPFLVTKTNLPQEPQGPQGLDHNRNININKIYVLKDLNFLYRKKTLVSLGVLREPQGLKNYHKDKNIFCVLLVFIFCSNALTGLDIRFQRDKDFTFPFKSIALNVHCFV